MHGKMLTNTAVDSYTIDAAPAKSVKRGRRIYFFVKDEREYGI